MRNLITSACGSRNRGADLRALELYFERGELFMDFNGNHEFAASQSKVYAAFFDANILAAAIPGCKEAKWADPQTLTLVVELNIPGLKGFYEGQVKVSEQQEPTHFK